MVAGKDETPFELQNIQSSRRKRFRTSNAMSRPTNSPSDSEGPWIAIEPLTREHRPALSDSVASPVNPPSFADSQFDIVLRRQRVRPREGGGVKPTAIPSRFLNLSNEFEFSGWGTVSTVFLTREDLLHGEETLQHRRRGKILGQFTASALSGNDVFGSVFYVLPAIVAVSGVYSPISLMIAALMLFLWRPIMEELASALPINGAPYTYLLNVTSKSLALIGAAISLLDFASTAVVSAATAASYLAGEVTLPFPTFVGTILVITIFTAVSLSGMKESARVAFAVLSLHVITMLVIWTASAVSWGRIGSQLLKENWAAGQAASSASIGHQLFNGVCIGMLGLTGFECTPAYIASIKPGLYPLVLRNLHLCAIFLTSVTMVFVLANVPLDRITSDANVLSDLAERAAGQWLRIWTVIDAIVVLCGGVLTGILSACELIERLAHDRVLPKSLLKTMPVTGSPYLAVLAFVAFSGALYASAGASLSIVSKMFSLVWLSTMTLFPLAVLFLKFSRGRLPREPKTRLSVVFVTLAICAAVFCGNVVIDLTTLGYFAAYLVAIILLFYAAQNKGRFVRLMYWAYDQNVILHNWSYTRNWAERLTEVMMRMRRQPVCVLCKTDEINNLFQMVLYVRQNEETSNLKLVHFCDDEDAIPSEMEANWKILDEAFPEMTVDLIFVKEQFNPATVAALAHRLNIPSSLMFMSCSGSNFPHSVADFGTRIISL
ncbi:hypothetical protein NEOLEDRAFT_1177956 [Neolentinus lepideus HHB14362 ss-1]|uniref:AAAP amino acid permease n=1 Tax=Neolentinus lepideus HHB14362 ss-1 TaxID=1314782 RepID=A0A165T5I1_9AGAM|nr:hypothetical protein NEOLEDRAFT_1177956 [Neolentinus lepideus HHB14362 ss-1]